jgi:hypothetical protein
VQHSLQHDENYFVNTLAPFGRGSYAGAALLQEVFEKYATGEKQKLVGKVLNEFHWHMTSAQGSLWPSKTK